MKPIVEYEVATTVDPTPLNLLTNGPDYEKYHTTWLNDKWLPFLGFFVGSGAVWYQDVMARKPIYAGKF
jgi:hypothetical protein